jgi:hypothetical protein
MYFGTVLRNRGAVSSTSSADDHTQASHSENTFFGDSVVGNNCNRGKIAGN